MPYIPKESDSESEQEERVTKKQKKQQKLIDEYVEQLKDIDCDGAYVCITVVEHSDEEVTSYFVPLKKLPIEDFVAAAFEKPFSESEVVEKCLDWLGEFAEDDSNSDLIIDDEDRVLLLSKKIVGSLLITVN